jgi:hypothetical protein
MTDDKLDRVRLACLCSNFRAPCKSCSQFEVRAGVCARDEYMILQSGNKHDIQCSDLFAHLPRPTSPLVPTLVSLSHLSIVSLRKVCPSPFVAPTCDSVPYTPSSIRMIRQMDAGAAADGQQPQVLRIEQGEALPLPLQQHSVRAALSSSFVLAGP